MLRIENEYTRMKMSGETAADTAAASSTEGASRGPCRPMAINLSGKRTAV